MRTTSAHSRCVIITWRHFWKVIHCSDMMVATPIRQTRYRVRIKDLHWPITREKGDGMSVIQEEKVATAYIVQPVGRCVCLCYRTSRKSMELYRPSVRLQRMYKNWNITENRFTIDHHGRLACIARYSPILLFSLQERPILRMTE